MEARFAIQRTKHTGTRNVCGMFHEAHTLMQERLEHIKWQEQCEHQNIAQLHLFEFAALGVAKASAMQELALV